jgi:Raf kinase inhibitor-like YbhB/YbcL family protein
MLLLLSACTSSTSTAAPEATQPAISESASTEITQSTSEATMSLQLTSDAFANGQSIPAKYSCVGKNISPALAWSEPPAGTQSFALIVDDPDAPMGTWVHWVLYNIPADTRSLAEGFSPENSIAAGKNSSSHLSYDGPCPPSGTHRYYFKLYALDTTLSLSPGATKDQLLKAMDGHILAQGELMGTFSK